jgi:hypothetical protein
MAFDGSGTYSAPVNSFNPAVAATDISPTDWNSLLADLSTALSTCVTKDGQTTPTAIVPFGTTGISTSIVKFPAVQVASADANTLDDYEEGTWTPIDSSGAALSFSSVTGKYTKIGNMVSVYGVFTFPVTADATSALIGGLPFHVSQFWHWLHPICAGWRRRRRFSGGLCHQKHDNPQPN